MRDSLPKRELIPIAKQIWESKYRYRTDTCIEDTWWRVAKALVRTEKDDIAAEWVEKFYWAMEDFKFIPAGRILAGAGTDRKVTLFNCYVMGTIPDSLDGIFTHLREAALTMQQGGGVGMDFSTIRPKGALVKGLDTAASGPVSFMDCWDSMCKTIMSAGTRRGAMMGTLRCDHPDIEEFIEVKRDRTRLRNFNVSVLVTSPFMEAVKGNLDWALQFDGEIKKVIQARELWEKITRGAYDYAEPGVIFIDRINEMNNLKYCEKISATNPCGEQPLPPYGACLLGSINLAAIVERPFNKGVLNKGLLEKVVTVAVRMLDNVVDISNYPLPQQEEEARAKRRIGLGVTGLANALLMCGRHYGTREAQGVAATWMRWINETAYAASADLAEEKGSFPAWTSEHPYGRPLRNSHLTSIAPTGTISLLAGNVSSGIEPIFAADYERKVLEADGSKRVETVQDFAVHAYYSQFRSRGDDLPYGFVIAHDLPPLQHLEMQAALQPYVDSAISKTINCPRDMPFEEFQDLYTKAYDLGLKGCTAYRPNDITGEVLSIKNNEPSPPVETFLLAPRDPILRGRTYKLKWPQSEHALYITINDVEDDQGNAIPYEIFINSKNLEHYAWTVALTRMVSAIFRRRGDSLFVVEELKAVFDPRGGAFIAGAYVPSLLAAIGNIIEHHFITIGYWTPEIPETEPLGAALRILGFCTRCSSPNVVKESGCLVCKSCGHSSCG